MLKINILRNYWHRIKNITSLSNKRSCLWVANQLTKTTLFTFKELLAERHFYFRDGFGNKYLTPINNYSSFATYLSGARDPDIICFLESFLENGDFAIDIGANIGTYTLPLSAFCNEKGLVIAYECDVEMQYCLNVNILQSKRKNVITRGIALGCSNKLVSINVNSSNRGQSHVISPQTRSGNYTNELSLDEDLNKLNIRLPLKLIKIDVEGYEGNVIHGALHTIQEHKDLVIIMEHLSETESRSDSDKSAVQALLSLGFSPYTILQDGSLTRSLSAFGDNVLWSRSFPVKTREN